MNHGDSVQRGYIQINRKRGNVVVHHPKSGACGYIMAAAGVLKMTSIISFLKL